MRVFWRRGFAEASYDDLTRATGVSRKGLYTSFGDKRSLFIKALQRYRQKQAIEFLAELDQPDADMDAIHRLFLRFAELAKTPGGRLGCFMANTANSETIHDPDVQTQVHLHLRHTRNRFQAVLVRAGIPAERATSLGGYLTGLLQGLFLLSHAGAEHDLIDAHVREGLRVLDH